ncbi:MAG: T9SS type A sorting domain-containing protein [Ignavibacteriae bacterium]|nr:T9SS type A sorting domain-containing protein [Ignavibacteriota bacterium]
MNNEPAEAEMEQWTIIKDNILEVHNRLTCFRTDSIYSENILRDQELPAVYPISALENLYTYIGNSPFTNDTLSNPQVVNLASGFWGTYLGVSEHWMAFVDNEMNGIGVYNPLCNYFLAGMAGEAGYEALDGSTSYIAPIKKEALSKNSVYDYTYFIIVGTVEEIRNKVYELSEGFEEQIQKTEWEFNEEGNFESWQLNGASEGEVSNGYLQMNVIAGDPFMTNMDGMAIEASKFDEIIIKMKNNTADIDADLFFKNADTPQQYNRIRFQTVPNDSIYREYEVSLSENPNWISSIVMLRLDPVSSVSTGFVSIDYIHLKSVTTSLDYKISKVPNHYKLSQNFPNPFNPTTSISYSLPVTSNVNIKIFDITGKELKTLVNSKQLSGNHKIIIDASELSSGVYFYSMRASSFYETKKILLIR